MKTLFKTLLVILWMIIIFLFSNQPSDDSSKLSDGFILRGVRIIESISHKNYNDEEILNKFVRPVRKLAHFTIYFVLGLLVFNLVRDFSDKIILSILTCLLYSLTDEIHQLFIIGRSGEIRDVIIDTLGSLLAIIIFKTIVKKKKMC